MQYNTVFCALRPKLKQGFKFLASSEFRVHIGGSTTFCVLPYTKRGQYMPEILKVYTTNTNTLTLRYILIFIVYSVSPTMNDSDAVVYTSAPRIGYIEYFL